MATRWLFCHRLILQVVPGAERLVTGASYDRAARAALRDFAERVRERTQRRLIERVEALGTVDGERADVAGVLNQDQRFRHAGDLSAGTALGKRSSARRVRHAIVLGPSSPALSSTARPPGHGCELGGRCWN